MSIAKMWRAALAVALCGVSISAFGASCVTEYEPNDTPATANPMASAGCFVGELDSADQDAIAWTVTEADARYPWQFTLDGLRDQLTKLEVFAVEFAPDGTGVLAAEQLLQIATPTGFPVTSEPRLFAPGTYIIGLSASGGSGPYAVNIKAGDVIWPFEQYGQPDSNTVRTDSEFSVAGMLHGPQEITWDVTEQDAEQLWGFALQAAIGAEPTLIVRTPAGNELVHQAVNASGRLHLSSLGLTAGTHTIVLTPSSEVAIPFSLAATAQGTKTAGHEVEPNDDRTSANALAVFAPMAGTLASGGDYDYFQFVINETTAGHMLHLELEVQQEAEVCLLSATGSTIQCRIATGGVRLPNLQLPIGTYFVGVHSYGAETDESYVLTLQDGDAPTPGFATEPNDTPAWAYQLGSEYAVKGELSGADVDVLEFTVTGEPQLWRIQAIGAGVEELAYLKPGGNQIVERGEGRVRLDNVYLLPGTHYVRVRGTDSDYAVRLLPLGPPSEPPSVDVLAEVPTSEQLGAPTLTLSNGVPEHEPNDTPTTSNVLEFAEPRIGTLASEEDTDVYRFTLANGEHVRIVADPPADGGLSALLQWGETRIEWVHGEVGEAIVGQEWLGPGEYYLHLRAYEPSDNYYQVRLERENPFTVAPERSANYSEWLGQPAEAQVPAALPLEMHLTNSTGSPVAAFWPYGQHGELTLHIANAGADSLDVALDYHATDATWQLAIPSHISLAAGEERIIAVPLMVAPDARAREVVFTIRAATEEAQHTTSLALSADPYAIAETSHLTWPVPETLLGGVDAAWLALGAEPTYQSTEEQESAERLGFPYTLDGMAPLDHDYISYRMYDWFVSGHGFTSLPVAVQLAGEEPILVAGFMLNPTSTGHVAYTLANFAVHVSVDGEEYEEVLTGTLSPHQSEQAFVLEIPVLARFARLELRTNHLPNYDGEEITLGEFKVIAAHESAAAVLGNGANLADPERGGRVVWANPGDLGGSGYRMLLADDRYPDSRLDYEQTSAEWIVGFLHGRAAQVQSFEWEMPAGSGRKSFSDIQLSVSLNSPAGPWEPVAEWSVDPTPGATSVLHLPEPVWARYVRFTATNLVPREYYDWPRTVRIIERAPDSEYRSALGEWGHYSRFGPYEFMHGIPARQGSPTTGNISQETAAVLAPSAPSYGTVERGNHEAWYEIRVPETANHIALTLTGPTTVEFTQELLDQNGNVVAAEVNATPEQVTVQATVVPGTYWLRIYEPPRSVVITWDTSGSVAASLPIIYTALARFASDVAPDIEEVNLLPFDSPFLMTSWSSDPLRVLQAINDDPRATSSSSGERALRTASEALADRPGKKAIIFLTDGAVSREYDLWETLLRVRPQVFASEITAAGDLVPNARYEQALMQDYASVNNGYYEYVQAGSDYDVSFQRAAAYLRRPSEYTVQLALSQRWERASAWAEPELAKAAELGLIPAVLAGQDLTAPVTRAEFAAVAVRVYEALTGETAVAAPVNPFTDTADPEVLKAYHTELAVGVSATEFAPDALLNREQAATILTRVFKKVHFAEWTWAADAEFALAFEQPAQFTDDEFISPWARESVYFMAANGIITGTGGGAFEPRAVTPEQHAIGYANATREQALLLAVRLVNRQIELR